MLNRMEVGRSPLRADVQRELGSSACGGCPLVALGCPGKQEAAPECPPEARVIRAEQASSALFDESVGSIISDGSGGFVALPEKASMFQTALLTPQPKPKPPVKKKLPTDVEKSPKKERWRRDKRLGSLATRGERQGRDKKPGLMSVLGELAMIFFGGTPSELAKK